MHIVLSFSPVGNAFRERLRKFPSLVNCTTIDWWVMWGHMHDSNFRKTWKTEKKRSWSTGSH